MSSSSPTDNTLAIFCDFENVALGVRDAQFPKFDMQLVLERLLLKGNIVVKKAYCDWDRYKQFKSTMHETAFELIEIPHTRMSGKNSADIRMVVDALDLCYTKDHIDAFVIISGDSDFSPLVSKLRENAKIVIGVGVRNSTSDLLINNCDEFLFYDDLVQASDSTKSRRKKPAKSTTSPNVKPTKKDPKETAKAECIDLVLDVVEDLLADRGDKVWGSMVKQTLKRRKPSFSETGYGFQSFSEVLKHATDQGLIKAHMDERSGGYVITEMTRD